MSVIGESLVFTSRLTPHCKYLNVSSNWLTKLWLLGKGRNNNFRSEYKNVYWIGSRVQRCGGGPRLQSDSLIPIDTCLTLLMSVYQISVTPYLFSCPLPYHFAEFYFVLQSNWNLNINIYFANGHRNYFETTINETYIIIVYQNCLLAYHQISRAYSNNIMTLAA